MRNRDYGSVKQKIAFKEAVNQGLQKLRELIILRIKQLIHILKLLVTKPEYLIDVAILVYWSS